MKTLLHDGQRMIELRRRHEGGPSDSVMNFGTPDLALLFLLKFKSDLSGMALLRRFAAYNSGQPSLSRISDHQVLKILARSISDRQIQVVLHKGSAPFRGGSGQPSIPKPAPPQPKATAARPAPPEPIKTVAAPLPMEEAVFASVDVAAQAATLKSAAQSGAPFCEECAKAQSA